MAYEADQSSEGVSGEQDRLAEFPRDAKPWLDDISSAIDYFSFYNDKCDSIEKLYSSLEKMANGSRDREFQMFWANMEVVKPSVYARPPVPVVGAKFRQRKPLLTKSAEVLERTLIASFDAEDIDGVLRGVRDDQAISGRGVPWLRFETDASGQERVIYEHLGRRDFLHQPARKWSEVGWVARRGFLTREQGLERFGDIFLEVAVKEVKDSDDKAFTKERKATVWEIWSKEEGLVVWVSPDCKQILDVQEPPLVLDKFFPCPRPAYATLQMGTLIPVPDFVYYKDQLEEINSLTARIASLTESLRMKGFYPAGNDDVAGAIEKVFKETDHGAVLVPVASGAGIMGQTLKDSIVWLPVMEVAQAIREVILNRKQLIEDIYQITGLSDIMRGNTSASETATAQQLKAQYGSVRLRDRQGEMVRVAHDVTKIAGEIIAEHFSPETLKVMSQTELPSLAELQQMEMQNPQMAMQQQQMPLHIEQVVELFRNQRLRPFVLEIETDSTIQPDENAEKQRRAEFITAIGGFMQQAVPMVQMIPQSAGLVGETLKFVAAGFRAGREIEAEIDEFANSVKEMAKQPKPPPPEQIKAEADAKAKQAELMHKEKLAAVDMQARQQDAQFKGAEMQAKIQEMQARMELEREKLNIERERLEIDRQRAALDAENSVREQERKSMEFESKNSMAEREFEEREKDRQLSRDSEMTRAGMPPDYSFDEDRQQFKAFMERGEKTDAVIAQMIETVSGNSEGIAKALADLSKAVSAPKRVIRGPDGSPQGIVADMGQ